MKGHYLGEHLPSKLQRCNSLQAIMRTLTTLASTNNKGAELNEQRAAHIGSRIHPSNELVVDEVAVPLL